MEGNNTWLWVSVIIIIVLIVVYFVSRKSSIEEEGFYGNQGYFKRYCSTCGDKNSLSCSVCSNCGLCTTVDGQRFCCAGDSTGPFYRNDCYTWQYGSPYSYFSYQNVFPVIKTFDQYPRSIINSDGFRYKWGYNKYQEELRAQAKQTRELQRRIDHGLA